MKHLKKVVPLVIVLFGLFILSIPSLKYMYSDYKQSTMIAHWNRLKQSTKEINENVEVNVDIKQDVKNKEIINSDKKNKDEYSDLNLKNSSDEREEIVFDQILRIPSIDLKMPVFNKLTNSNLAIAPCHMEKTVFPGQKGNCAISGHRCRKYGKQFNRLGEIKVNDKIHIETLDNEFIYKVINIYIVEPEDTWVLEGDDEYLLTLITCDPIETGTHRLIIRAELENNAL